MERLCKEGVSYARAFSPAPWTLPSTVSIFSGKLPTEHGITGDCLQWEGDRPSSPANAIASYAGPWLTDSFKDRGYETWGGSCNAWITEWGGFSRGFDQMLYLDVRRGHRKPLTKRIQKLGIRARHLWGKKDHGGKQAVGEFVNKLAETGRKPLFAVVNLMEVHSPYDPPRPFYPHPFWKRKDTVRLSNSKGLPGKWLLYSAGLVAPPAGYREAVSKLYFSAARYEDWLLGRFISAVEDKGRPTVIAVVSDHGENLGEHGMYAHNSSLNEPLLHVPLVVWGSKVEVGNHRVDEQVAVQGLADWLVGLADGNGTPIVSNGPIISEYESAVRFPGLRSNVRERVRKADPALLPPLLNHSGVAIRIEDRKLVATDGAGDALYDLASDPGEEHNILDWKPEAIQGFLPYKQAWFERRVSQPTYEAGDRAEDDIVERLRMLGYVE